jgi:hypothetical protein
MSDIGLDVRLAGGPGAREQVAVARGVHRDLRKDRAPARLALEHRAAHGAVLHDRLRSPAVQREPHLVLEDHLLRKQLETLRIDGRRPGHHAVESAGALRPVGGALRLARAPVLARRSRDRVPRQAREDLLGEAADHAASFPVRHAVDPDHQAAGGEAAQMVVALEQDHVGAESRRRHRGRRAGRTAAGDEHVAACMHRNFARRFAPRAEIGSRRTRALIAAEDFRLEEFLVGLQRPHDAQMLTQVRRSRLGARRGNRL